jgi:hypothetical protein
MFSLPQRKLGPQGPIRLVVPQVFSEPILHIEGTDLEIVEFGESESKHIAPVHIPALRALLSADLVYNHVHLYLQERHLESWLSERSSQRHTEADRDRWLACACRIANAGSAKSRYRARGVGTRPRARSNPFAYRRVEAWQSVQTQRDWTTTASTWSSLSLRAPCTQGARYCRSLGSSRTATDEPWSATRPRSST